MGDYILNAFQQYMNNIQNINDRNILIVTKGWEKKYLNQIKLEKFFSISLDISIQELSSLKPKLLIETTERYVNSKDKNIRFWCTYEEYL